MWNFDMSQAPRGTTHIETRTDKDGKERTFEIFRSQKIIAASACGIVTVSKWIPEDKRGGGGRWECFSKDVPPVAWQPWPTHPHTGAM